jgi:hypothetical protein
MPRIYGLAEIKKNELIGDIGNTALLLRRMKTAE